MCIGIVQGFCVLPAALYLLVCDVPRRDPDEQKIALCWRRSLVFLSCFRLFLSVSISKYRSLLSGHAITPIKKVVSAYRCLFPICPCEINNVAGSSSCFVSCPSDAPNGRGASRLSCLRSAKARAPLLSSTFLSLLPYVRVVWLSNNASVCCHCGSYARKGQEKGSQRERRVPSSARTHSNPA